MNLFKYAAGSRTDRRQFLKSAARAAGAMAIPYAIFSAAFGGGVRQAPSNRITLGFIGVGMQGRGLLWSFLNEPDCVVVAVCDVDKQKAEHARKTVDDYYGERSLGRGNPCVVFAHFRELLTRPDIDAVVIAVPDHWHSIIATEACRAGKDVYCEKPLALAIGEARQMVNAARRYGRVFQTGSMQRSDSRFRRACELVRNGYIGQVKTVSVSITVEGFPMVSQPCDLGAQPVPEYLDWDMWLGPAPWRPYNSRLAPPLAEEAWAHWRDYDDYSGGMMTDWGAHHFDIAQWGLGMDATGPVEVYPPDGTGGPVLTYKYANGVTLTRDDVMRGKSIIFTGADGRVEVSRDFLRTKPSSLSRQRLGPNEIRLYKSDNHYADWLGCIRSRQRPVCDVEIGCRSVTVCHLGNIAYRLGRPLKWDPAQEHFVDDPQADRMLWRPMRAPWTLPL